jgi:ArsR family transcriptional regulator
MQRQISKSGSFHLKYILLPKTKSVIAAVRGIQKRESHVRQLCTFQKQSFRFADMFSAMGTEARLRIMQLLMTAEPKGIVVGDIQSEIEIPNSTLSHHLDKLKNENLVTVRREGTYLWYRANIDALKDLLGFLYAECCTRNHVVAPKDLVSISR